MSFCSSNCAVVVPTAPSQGCKITTRKGGIKRLIYASCDITFADLTDLNEWQEFIDYDKIHASGEILGSKPKGTFEKKKVASCRAEQIVGGTKVINFSDYNADDTAFLDYGFYNSIMTNHGNMVVGYVDCNDNFYGWIENFSAEIDDEREEDVKGNTFFAGSLTYEAIEMIVPVNIPGLNAILS